MPSAGEVDSRVENRADYEVVMSLGAPLSAYMNWSDLAKNHNKFYIVQALQKKGNIGLGKPAWVYTRWGRVGVVGSQNMQQMSIEKALSDFAKKKHEKTKKGYFEIQIASGAGG